jgi:hypothetical protein
VAETKTPTHEEALANALAEPETMQEEVHVPEHVKAWVEREYPNWQGNPDAWRKVTLPSLEDAEKTISQARAYCTVRSPRLSVQIKQGFPAVTPEGHAVVAYKIRDKMNRGRQPGSRNQAR